MDGRFTNLLSELFINLLCFEKEHYNPQKLGTPWNYFGLLKEGQGHFFNEACDFTVKTGEMVYIPKGCIHTSHWTGDKTVEFYSLAFRFQNPELNGAYSLQKVPDGEDLAEAVRRMYENYDNPNRSVSLFYDFYEKACPLLQPEGRKKIRPSIYPAMKYLEQHCCEDIRVETLADLCHISEPYFYSTFKREAGCTPITYKNRIKCEKAVEMLFHQDCTLDTLCSELNFSSPAFLRKLLKQFTGKTPKQIREERYNI